MEKKYIAPACSICNAVIEDNLMLSASVYGQGKTESNDYVNGGSDTPKSDGSDDIIWNNSKGHGSFNIWETWED